LRGGSHGLGRAKLRVEAGRMVDVTDANSSLLSYAHRVASQRRLLGSENGTAVANGTAAGNDDAVANDAGGGPFLARAMNWTRVWGRHGSAEGDGWRRGSAPLPRWTERIRFVATSGDSWQVLRQMLAGGGT